MRVNLGCCKNLPAGYVNVDRVPPADRIMDLEQRWAFEDSSVDELRASHILEHLRDPIHTMNEAWRVLRPGGRFVIDVPTTDGRGAWQDPTHVSFWNRNSFWYFELGHDYHDTYADHYGIRCAFRVVRGETDPDGFTMHGPHHVAVLHIVLEAVK